MGLAVFSGVAGKTGPHAHWTHQIVVDLDGNKLECYCDKQWFRSVGVFVPAGHPHSVPAGNQISLFFDSEIDWIADAFGGKLDTSCASVLDHDVLLGIRTCFHEKMTLTEGLQIIAEAFEFKLKEQFDEQKRHRWTTLLSKVEDLQKSSDLLEDKPYSQLGALFAL